MRFEQVPLSEKEVALPHLEGLLKKDQIRTPLTGESERVREQSGHSTKAMPLSANRLRSMGQMTMEIMSNFQPQKIGLKVRRNGPQPSIFVRTFSAITNNVALSSLTRIIVRRF
jgi:hypothetical protein